MFIYQCEPGRCCHKFPEALPEAPGRLVAWVNAIGLDPLLGMVAGGAAQPAVACARGARGVSVAQCKSSTSSWRKQARWCQWRVALDIKGNMEGFYRWQAGSSSSPERSRDGSNPVLSPGEPPPPAINNLVTTLVITTIVIDTRVILIAAIALPTLHPVGAGNGPTSLGTSPAAPAATTSRDTSRNSGPTPTQGDEAAIAATAMTCKLLLSVFHTSASASPGALSAGRSPSSSYSNAT